MRNFSMISPTIWQSKRFKQLSQDAKLLIFYLMTGPHAVSIGCYRLPAGYALTDLGWDMPTYRAAIDELKEFRMISEDENYDLIWINKWEKFVDLRNSKHRTAAEALFKKLPDSPVSTVARECMLKPYTSVPRTPADEAIVRPNIPEHLNTKYLDPAGKGRK